MSSLLTYKYFDTPEGEDIYAKTFVLSKYALGTGLVLGTYDVLFFSHPQGIMNSAARYLYFTGPLIGMATAFSVTTTVAQKIRGKNDLLNYFMGGVAAGSIFGAWQKSITKAVPVAVILGVCAMAKKMSVDEGWVFFPDVKHSTKSATSVRNDWTILSDLPRQI